MARRMLVVQKEAHYRKPFVRRGKIVKGADVKASTFKIPDVGRPGRGPKLIKTRTPEQRKRKYGHVQPMNSMAENFGHKNATQVPSSVIDPYVQRLVEKYGERSARGMIQAQINFRKNSKSQKVLEAKKKFEAMIDSLDKHFKGGGWQ